MRVTFIGTAGSYLTSIRSYPSILINDDLLLDCGEGTTQKLLKINSIGNIKTICITHLHNDHFLGIFSLLWYYWLSRRKASLEIIGPPNTSETIEKILTLINTTELMRNCFNITYTELKDLNEIQILKRKYNIKAIKVDHSITALAYRIDENDKSICYSGDTAPSQNLITLAQDCNLLIHEATFPDEYDKLAHHLGHSTPKDLAKIANLSHCKNVAIMHISASFSNQFENFRIQAEKSFNGKIVMTEDLMNLEI